MEWLRDRCLLGDVGRNHSVESVHFLFGNSVIHLAHSACFVLFVFASTLVLVLRGLHYTVHIRAPATAFGMPKYQGKDRKDLWFTQYKLSLTIQVLWSAAWRCD